MPNYNHILLPLELDKETLKKELDQIVELGWNTQKPFSTIGVPGLTTTTYHEGNWKIISLRSVGGDDNRTDPGGPSLSEYSDTKYMAKAPYIKSIIDRFGEYVRTVRLSVLYPGEQIHEHSDTYLAFRYGHVRLHVPIISNDNVKMSIGGELKQWSEGELWYGDFSSAHSVINNGTTPRVHLIIDVCICDELLSLFSEEVLSEIGEKNILRHQLGTSIPQEELAKFECDFLISAGLIKGVFEFDDGIPGESYGRITLVDQNLIFFINDIPIFSLISIAKGEFRFMGWSMERTLTFEMEDDKITAICFEIHSGDYTSKVLIPTVEKAKIEEVQLKEKTTA